MKIVRRKDNNLVLYMRPESERVIISEEGLLYGSSIARDINQDAHEVIIGDEPSFWFFPGVLSYNGVWSITKPEEYEAAKNNNENYLKYTSLLKEKINEERNRRISSGFIWNGKLFQSDEDSRENIAGAATSATAYMVAGGSPTEVYWQSPDTPFVWLAEDNTQVQMTPAQVIEFGNAALAHKKALIFAARTIKDMNPIPSDYTDDKYWP